VAEKLDISASSICEGIGRPRTTISDFWCSSGPVVSYRRGNGVAFDPEIFMKLLINFIISNSLALRIVESISLQQLLEYCLGDIELPFRRLMMRTMLSFYIEAYEAVKAVLQEHLKDGSRLCLTGDGWSQWR
jgi:hypothetical protein